MLWRVAWRSWHTGYEGHGEPTTYENAKTWADYGNRKWGKDIYHWPEPVPSDEEVAEALASMTNATQTR